MAYPCAFDQLLSKSVPHILENIFFSLDYDSYKKCIEVNNIWKELLASEQFKKKAKSKFHERMLQDEKELLRYAKDGVVDKLDVLLSIGCNPNCQTIGPWWEGGGRTALHWAASKGHTAVVKLLINFWADINLKDELRETPLMKAVCYESAGVVKLLLDAGAQPNAADGIGRTPLYHAIKNGYNDVVKILLEAGAGHTTNNFGITALHQAASIGNTHVVIRLLKAGADPNVAYFHKTPLSVALIKGHKNVVKVLLEAGAKP